MVLKRLYVAFLVVLATGFSPVLATKSGDFTGSLEAFRVVLTDNGQETFLPADQASPNDVIEYRVTYRNARDDAIQSIFITDPIPTGSQYIEESATKPSGGRVEFSIDGGRSFKEWPITIERRTSDGRTLVEQATPDMVTHIRWIISQEVVPEREITLTYRTFIK